MLTKKRVWLTLTGICVLVLGGLVFLSTRPTLTGEAHARDGTSAGTSLSVIRPQRQDMVMAVEQPARIEAFEQTPIHARISGYVGKVHADIGSRVKLGDVLAELSVPELHEELAQKKAQVVQTRLDITQAEKSLTIAQTRLRSAEAAVELAKAGRKRAAAHVFRWKSLLDRMEKLADDRVIDPRSRDETRGQHRAAEADLEEAEARIKAAEAARDESQARLDKATADLASARNHLVLAQADERRVAAMVGYARLTAPYDGVVTQRNIHTGHLLQPPGDSSKTGPLFVVVRMDKVRVFVDVPEAQAIHVQSGNVGCPARVRVPGLNDRWFKAKVCQSAWSLDSQQRTMRAEINLDNPEGLLRPGMYAHAVVDATHARAWTLPAATVLTQDGVVFCWMEQDGKARKMLLKTGLRASGRVEVLKKQTAAETGAAWVDFTGTERVLSGGLGGMREGQPVQPMS